MKCIDIMEGTVKSILERLYQLVVTDNLDDSEYVRNVKAVIEAVDLFLQKNPELIDDPALLKKVLYVHSRNLWLFGNQQEDPSSAKPVEILSEEQEEYQTYYFDYLYNRGLFPR